MKIIDGSKRKKTDYNLNRLAYFTFAKKKNIPNTNKIEMNQIEMNEIDRLNLIDVNKRLLSGNSYMKTSTFTF